jgi:hypothetical protein
MYIFCCNRSSYVNIMQLELEKKTWKPNTNSNRYVIRILSVDFKQPTRHGTNDTNVYLISYVIISILLLFYRLRTATNCIIIICMRYSHAICQRIQKYWHVDCKVKHKMIIRANKRHYAQSTDCPVTTGTARIIFIVIIVYVCITRAFWGCYFPNKSFVNASATAAAVVK